MISIQSKLKEIEFETHIERELVKLHKYLKRDPEQHYDRALALDKGLLFEFLKATQGQKIERLKELYGDAMSNRVVNRIDEQIASRGIIDVLRKGVEEGPVRLELMYFRPTTSFNPEVEKLYKANIFSVMRQVKFSQNTEQSVDLAIFINGLPIVTAELKNELTGQNVQHAKRQYTTDRSPDEKLFSFKRCVAHFAVDTCDVYVTTKLNEDKTYFLPFNKGFENGAGNPPVEGKHKTYYLWEDVWSPDNWSDMLQYFVHFYIDTREDRFGREYKVPVQVFPRYQQWDTVKRLLATSRATGAGKNYLIQHSAGSGKSMTIAWLAYRLADLHKENNEKVYDSVIVITDRRALDKQLRETIRSFEATPGLLVAAGENGTRLKEALASGAKIVTTTIQKFPFVFDLVAGQTSKKYALIVDEAHSSQSGELARAVHDVLTTEEQEDWLLAQINNRQQPENISYFAFTATPKHETLERFGIKQPDGSFVPFSLYSMRQAIEEHFILDVLTNYTTYKTYFKIIKTAAEDPVVPRNKALSKILRYVYLHNVTLKQKAEIIVNHFENTVRDMFQGESKAMIVTSSREAVVRYKTAIDNYLRDNGYLYKTLAAFTDSIEVDGINYTETSINEGIPEDNTAREFKKPEYRFLIVAEKYQTGFDEPFLCAMYVDKTLSGVQAVQTLSRLNRMARDKDQVYVLDFINNTDDVKEAFEPYYTTTIISEGTDINTLNDLRQALLNIYQIQVREIDGFIGLIDPEAEQIHEKANAFLDELAERIVAELEEAAYKDFLSVAWSYVKRYPYVAQILSCSDVNHEKLYLLLKYLLKKLPRIKGPILPEIINYLDMDSVRVVRKLETKINLGEEGGDVKVEEGVPSAAGDELLDPLSQIIKDVNKKWGLVFGSEQQETLTVMSKELVEDEEIQNVVSNNPKRNAEIHFEKIFGNKVDDQFERDRKLWEQLTNNQDLRKYVEKRMFKIVSDKVLAQRE